MTTAPADSLPLLVLRRHEDRRIRAGHCWVFSNEIDTAATPLTALRARRAVRVRRPPRPVPGSCAGQSACADLRAHRVALERSSRSARRCSPSGCAARWRCASAMSAASTTGWCTASPTACRDWWSTAMATCWSAQIATLGMERAASEIEAALRRVLAPAVLVWKNDGNARDLESLPHGVQLAGRRGCPRSAGHGAGRRACDSDGAAGRRPEDRLVLRPDGQSRAAARATCAPGARVLDVCSYVGGWAVSALAAGAADGAVRGFLAAALDWAQRNARAQRRRASQRDAAMPSTCWRRCTRRASASTCCRRSARIHQAPQGPAQGRGGLSQAEPAGAAAGRADEALLVSCSCSWHLPAEALPTLLQSARAPRGRRAADHRAAAGSRRTIRCIRRCRRRATSRPCSAVFPDKNRADDRSYPDIDPIALRLGPAAGPLVRHHVRGRLRRGLVAGAAAGRAAGQHLEGRAMSTT